MCCLRAARRCGSVRVYRSESVRAGLCESPEDYRWCSYASAVAGNVDSRKGLARLGDAEMDECGGAEHRLLLLAEVRRCRAARTRGVNQ